MMAIFLRALEETADKDRALREAIRSPGRAMGRTWFDVDPTQFVRIPKSPFAYWAGKSVQSTFSLGVIGEFTAKVGLQTDDDFRFVRLNWEVRPSSEWVQLAKGGAWSPYYNDLHLVLNWRKQGVELKELSTQRWGNPGKRIFNEAFYFRPGLTWTQRTQSGLSLRALASGCIFATKGPAAFVDGDGNRALLGLLAIANSRPFRALVDLQMAFGSYDVGVIQRTPAPKISEVDKQGLAKLAHTSWSLRRNLDTRTETSHAFQLPALLQIADNAFLDRIDFWMRRVADTVAELARLQAEIDDRCFEFYGMDGADREQIERGLGGSTTQDDAEDAENSDDDTLEAEDFDAKPLVASLLSWTVGVAYGRFDIRLATGERPAPPAPEPFDPLPVCSPGMLTGEDGLPLDAPPGDYTIDFPRDGILVDDAEAASDLVAAARQVFEHVFDDPASRWEEAAEILGERDRTLRTWFARDFFALHLKQYSKSRRKAPIYWSLSTASGSFTVWLYYHRLTPDSLFQVVVEYLDPKIRKVREERLQVDGRVGLEEGREAAKLAKQAGELAELEHELEEMKAELLRVAVLPYKPNLNDGVQITAAPLWKLFRLPAWRKVLEATWKKLEKGEYDWAHLAYAIWPDRVREKCKTDRSLAITHGLEGLCSIEIGHKKPRPSTGGS